MKVVLSRKGFDSENGGMPSAVMPNGEVVSFPIPSGGDRLCYLDLKVGSRNYGQLLGDLCNRHPQANHSHCHLDPDLDGRRWVDKPKGWRAAFGQDNSSASYLLNTVGIGPGDLFLFFGWFHQTYDDNGVIRFQKRSGDFYSDSDIHLIWGYLQVGEVVTDFDAMQKKCPWHPHADEGRRNDQGNVLFVARRTLTFAPGTPGAGLLPYNERRVLTAEGCSKAMWKDNAAYRPDNVVGSRKNSSRVPGTIYYSGIWQELGLWESVAVEDWAKGMILRS